VLTGINSGKDTIVFTYTNYCGTNYTLKPVYIKALPAGGTIIGNDSVCVGSSLTLFETSIYGSWSATNGTATVQPIITGGLVSGVAAGLDTVIYSVSNDCGVAFDSINMQVIALPDTPSISGVSFVCKSGRLDTLTVSPSGGVWTSSNDYIVTIIGDTAIGVNPGVAAITYTISNYCGSASESDSIHVYTTHQCDSIEAVSTLVNPESVDEFKLYPNPSSDAFYVRSGVSLGNVVLTIRNIYGIPVWTAQTLYLAAGAQWEIQTGGLTSGNYIVEIKSGLFIQRLSWIFER
jgi:hypothetical protein